MAGPADRRQDEVVHKKWLGLVVFVDERADNRAAVQKCFPGEAPTPIRIDPNNID